MLSKSIHAYFHATIVIERTVQMGLFGSLLLESYDEIGFPRGHNFRAVDSAQCSLCRTLFQHTTLRMPSLIVLLGKMWFLMVVTVLYTTVPSILNALTAQIALDAQESEDGCG